MAIKINDNTITGNIHYNGDKVLAVYINDKLAWEALPGNNITLTIYRRVENGVPGFRIVLAAEHYVTKDITVNVQYNSSGASTTVTIYRFGAYCITDWREGYADMAFITGVSPQSDSTYRYTYTPSGVIKESAPVINSLITAEAIQYYYSPPVPVTKTYTLRVESQYYVENWSVSAYFDLGEPSTWVTLRNTKSKTITETGKEAIRCEWGALNYPPPDATGYKYVMGPTTFRVIDKR